MVLEVCTAVGTYHAYKLLRANESYIAQCLELPDAQQLQPP